MFDQINQSLINYPIIRWILLAIFISFYIKPILKFFSELFAESMERRKERSTYREMERKQKEENLKMEKEYKRLELVLAQEERLAEYKKLRKDIEAMPQYEHWRQSVFEKFGRKCAVCGNTENLEVDHRYKSFYRIVTICGVKNIVQAYGCAELWDVNNGAPLCKPHHDETPSSRKYQEQIIKIKN